MAMDFVKEMVEARRCLHKRPEEGWTEFETTWFIAKRLKALDSRSRLGKPISVNQRFWDGIRFSYPMP